jgi:hypothetical protein
MLVKHNLLYFTLLFFSATADEWNRATAAMQSFDSVTGASDECLFIAGHCHYAAAE